ncbi:hypothetical protein NLX86_06485 [Streptomyces sp. A3M-1-3]|uniref:hypothetical protein n=1 Tax=Streptomyces sp. A3M-1-3 TaxID=2962044 RepID=UPI0020B665AB|nr:hypothetical protein [Streptomyces sp. A3M-1-3]MCP3817793.1 hypothetical protein [Streptomyces sp. A3M-1-3]
MTVLLCISISLVLYSLGVALVFRIIPTAVSLSRRPLGRMSAYLRMSWSAR